MQLFVFCFFSPLRHSGCLPIGQVSWLICKLKLHLGKAFHVYLYHILLSFGLFDDLLNSLNTVKFPMRVGTYE